MPEIERLIRLAVAGDSAAVVRLLLQYRSHIESVVTKRIPKPLRRRFSAEDVVQEASVGVFTLIRKFNYSSVRAFENWLVEIVANHLKNIVRFHHAGKRRATCISGITAHELSAGRLLDRLEKSQSTPSKLTGRAEVVAAIQLGLEGLAPDYKEAIRLRYLKEYSVSETAKAMNRTEGAVMNLCYRGLRQLRLLLHSASDFFTDNE